MASISSEKKQPYPEPQPDISPAHSRRASIDTLDTPAGPVPSSSTAPAAPAPPPAYTPSEPDAHIPTISAPFDFPPTSELPAYPGPDSAPSLPGDHKQSPIPHPLAIPQISPQATSPLLPAYPPALLALGIPSETWLSFVSTVSAFLNATVSTQALAHASEVAQHVAAGPTQLGRDLAAHSVSSAKRIAERAKRGDVGGVVHGAMGLAFGNVGRVVGGVVGLPGRTIGALHKRPRTPRERAEDYVAAANEDWLGPRGLRVRILGTGEVAALRGGSVEGLMRSGSAVKVLEALREVVGEMRVDDKTNSKVGKVEIGRETLWLVVEPVRTG